ALRVGLSQLPGRDRVPARDRAVARHAARGTAQPRADVAAAGRGRAEAPALIGMATARDHEHMARALELARRGLYNTDPNPRVGCVLVKDGRVVGEGFTAPAGGPHAERVALDAAGFEARGATAYVS